MQKFRSSCPDRCAKMAKAEFRSRFLQKNETLMHAFAKMVLCKHWYLVDSSWSFVLAAHVLFFILPTIAMFRLLRFVLLLFIWKGLLARLFWRKTLMSFLVTKGRKTSNLQVACDKPERHNATCCITIPPAGTVIALLGSNVTLPCPEGELRNQTLLRWKFEGRPVSPPPAGWDSPSASLFLPCVHRNHSGAYSCFEGSRPLHTLRLIVEEPPQVPDFACFRRSLAKDILCEWRPSSLVSPRTKASLWVQRFTGENHMGQQCRYYRRSQKFFCRIQGLNNDEDALFLVSVCVANLAGTARGQKSFHTDVLLRPDPPADVRVSAVEKEPHKLHVTWKNPHSWGTKYYHLQFQLRYRVETSSTFSEVHLKHGVTSYTIVDAVQNLPHVVQVRGREEFDHGNWSEWSRENIGVPWSDPQDSQPETTHYTSEVPLYPEIASTFTPPASAPSGHTDKPIAMGEAAVVPLHAFLIMAATITLGLALLAVVLARCRKKWGILPFGEIKPGPVPTYSLTPLSPEPPMSASPLLSPPTSPFSESSIESPRTPDQSPYDVSNADYFLLPK